MQKTRNAGFTLIELMIVVVVLAILAAIAYPSYLNYVRKARFSEAKEALFHLAAEAEQYYSDNKGYPKILADLGHTLEDGKYLSKKIVGELGDDSYYSLFISSTTTSYTLRADPLPLGKQDKDKRCKSFTLNHKGEKDVTSGTWKNTHDCW